MIRIATFEAKVGIRNQLEIESIISYLMKKGYFAMIRNMFTGLFKLAKLQEYDEQLITKMITEAPNHLFTRREIGGVLLGGLFINNGIIYVLNPIEQDLLQASAIGYNRQKEALQNFCIDIEEGIKNKFDGRRVRGMEFDWKPSKFAFSGYERYGYSPFEELFEGKVRRDITELKVSKPNYSSQDVKAANLLVDINTRKFILRLAQVGKMISKDAVNFSKTPATLQSLLSLGLITEEYLLKCKEDQHTICVVPSKGHLTQEPMATLRCSICGRSFPEENLQVIYTLTDIARKLVKGSLWMSIWLTELLKKSGVREEGIKWNIETSGEELDILVEDFDYRIFFELKDREFGLGDAYPFAFRVTRYGGQLGIIVTMDKVSPDAKKFFKEEIKRREYPIRIEYLEGPKNIREKITKTVEQIALLQIKRVTRPFSARIGFDLWPIIENWINIKK